MQTRRKSPRKTIKLDDSWNSPVATAKRMGYTDDTLARWRRAGAFPEPDGFSPSGVPLWLTSTIDRVLSEGAETFRRKHAASKKARLAMLAGEG